MCPWLISRPIADTSPAQLWTLGTKSLKMVKAARRTDPAFGGGGAEKTPPKAPFSAAFSKLHRLYLVLSLPPTTRGPILKSFDDPMRLAGPALYHFSL